jgi:phosphatidylglycerol---prolipoprotein diacylglyceryl transferase
MRLRVCVIIAGLLRLALSVLTHPQFDPIALSVGPIAFRWYGLMYVLAFVLFVVLGKLRAKNQPWHKMTAEAVDDIMFYGIVGVVLGGRLGYVIFYKPDYYLANPAEIIAVWKGGMSFHGGFLGVLAAIAVYAWRKERNWLALMDFIAPLVPLGYAAGRMGNFINGELPGRIIKEAGSVPWAMWFPQVDATPTARHPSQLYQFALDGIALFVLLWLFSKKPRPTGAIAGLFLAGYGSFRFITEFGREPDTFLGFLALGLSMGQWLSLPMVVAGIALMVWAYRRG